MDGPPKVASASPGGNRATTAKKRRYITIRSSQNCGQGKARDKIRSQTEIVALLAAGWRLSSEMRQRAANSRNHHSRNQVRLTFPPSLNTPTMCSSFSTHQCFVLQHQETRKNPQRRSSSRRRRATNQQQGDRTLTIPSATASGKAQWGPVSRSPS